MLEREEGHNIAGLGRVRVLSVGVIFAWGWQLLRAWGDPSVGA